MKTAIKEIQKQLQEWAPYLGKKAMIESTGYSACWGSGEKPLIELHLNILEDVKPYNDTLSFYFSNGGNNSGYGNLGCVSDRTRDRICFNADEVKEYTKKKLLLDKRIGDVSLNKQDPKLGSKYLTMTKFPHCGEFRIEIVYIKEFSLAQGVKFSGTTYADNMNDVYSMAEFDDLLNEVRNYCAELLGQPRIAKKPSLEFPRFVANILEVLPKGNFKKDSILFQNDDFYSFEHVEEFLEECYWENEVKVLITDTKEEKIRIWTKK